MYKYLEKINGQNVFLEILQNALNICQKSLNIRKNSLSVLLHIL